MARLSLHGIHLDREVHVWWMLWGSLALGAPCYQPEQLLLELQGAVPSDALLTRSVWKTLQDGGFKTLELEGPTGKHRFDIADGAPPPKRFTAEQLSALARIGLLDPGCEADMVIGPLGSKTATVPIQMSRRAKVVRVVQGPPIPAPAKGGPTEAEVRERHGIGELTDAGAAWSPESRAFLDRALSLLTPEERTWLAGLPARRVQRATRQVLASLNLPPGQSNVAAVYRSDASGSWIEVYDNALVREDRFVGNPDAPASAELFTLMHELGHALADAHLQQQIVEYAEVQAKGNAAVDRHNALVDQYNRLQAQRPQPVAKLTALADQLAESEAKVKRLQKRDQQLGDRINRERTQRNPVLLAYLEVAGKHSAFTPYAKASSHEAFAEAFALYKLDPDALKAIHADVFAWFKKGGHLKAIEDGAGL